MRQVDSRTVIDLIVSAKDTGGLGLLLGSGTTGADALPSPAHWALADIVEAGLFRRLYSPNHDDLLERSVGRQVGLRVVRADEPADHLQAGHEPVLFKLAGDGAIRDEPERSLIRAAQAAKLSAACSHGLVVVGYSGDDDSIMDFLTTSTATASALELVWLVGPDDEISDRVRRLLESSASRCLCRVASFDTFVAEVRDAYTRARSTARVARQLTDVRDLFVAHSDGVGSLMTRLDEALADPGSSVVCLSGLPGVGKTATVRHLLERLRTRYAGVVLISGKDRSLTGADLVDECFLQLPIAADSGLPSDRSVSRLLDFLGSTACLLLIDNADNAKPSVVEFVAKVPDPSRTLLTIRDPRALRAVVPQMWEVEHAGLTRPEMQELVHLWMQRNPRLGRKLGSASPGDIERLLVTSNGWPEAMVIMLTTLSNTLLHINEVDGRVRDDIYDFILGGLYSKLTRNQRQCLLNAGSFPLTFTLEGLTAVSGLRRPGVDRSVEQLVNANLLRELHAGQYTWAHPIVRDYVVAKAIRYDKDGNRAEAARHHLVEWSSVHGGQPRSDWSNFAQLDKEFENLKGLMEHLLASQEFGLLTTVYRNLFSYIVERGYWMFTEAWCERMVDQPLGRGDRADWLIWWSWIKFYLRQDYVLAARLAENALEQKPRQNRQRFEGHRRALVAYGRIGNADGVRRHQAGAAEICRRAWSRTSNESIDLLNSEASAYLALGTRLRDSHAIDHAMQLYRDAEQAADRRVDPNTREIGIAVLGQASCLAALGRHDAEALRFAQNALEYAWKVSWLRGIVEASELVAILADRLKKTDLARSARDVAARMGSRLRSPQPAGVAEAGHA